ncbi:DUF5672 family protein [Mucilaginibacter antarcticus]|uniref:DUF5672 family protein n=1 Tax=Mucilaginibacter antarcticus TaxID=1855725 RepID=A0ABW5XPH0_9SPHI
MASKDIRATAKALHYSSKDIEFGDVLLISHSKPFFLNKKIRFEYTSKTKSIDEWSYKIVYDLNTYINTDYIMLIHSDGFVVNPGMWQDDFLNYDYIGSPWPLPADDYSYRDSFGNIVRVGNSVSLRSKRLLELPSKINMPWEPFHGFYNEDGFICAKNKHIFEQHGIKYAPIDVAKYFAHENMIPEVKGIKPFAFHRYEGTNAQYPRFK